MLMVEASNIEAGRVPLQSADQATDALRPLSERIDVRTGLFGIILVAELVLSPLSLDAGFGFNSSDFFSSQVLHFSLATSLLDWVVLCVLRDICLGILICKSRGERSEATCGHARVARRISMFSLFIGIGRISFLDWSFPDTHKLLATVALAALMQPLLFAGAHVLVRSHEQHEKERARLAAAEEEAGQDAPDAPQYAGSLTLRQLLRVMKPYFWPSTGEPSEVFWNRTRALSTWFCVAGSKLMNLISPLFLAAAVNGVSAALQNGTTEPPAAVVWNLILYAFFILMSKTLKECQELVYIKVQQAAYIEISENTFVHLHNLSLDWHLRKKMGNVIRSMDRGIQAAQNTMKYVFLYLVPTLGEAFAVSLIFIFHFKNARLAIFTVLNLILYCYTTIKITLWRKQFRTATTKHDNDLHDRLTDSLVNYETIKYFTAEDYERREYRNVVQKYQKMSMATQASLSLLNILQQIIINFTLAGGMILATAQLLQDGSLGLGQFVAVNAYIVQTFAPLSFLGTIYNMVINGLVDMNSFGQLLAETSDVIDEADAQTLDTSANSGCPMIEFRNVSFHYRIQPLDRSIKNVAFSVGHGRTVALVGTTGSGKTTVTRLLFRFYDALAGQVLVNGKDVKSVTQKSLRQAMGFVPQDVVMFNASIEHNIKYGCIETASQAKVETAAKEAQLAAFIEQQPHGYETAVGERGLKLSGGEKQRLAIARCLVKNPPIVVLDEATSALDSQTEQKIQEALNVLSTARTVVAIAHRLSTIRYYDEVLVLEGGQIVQRGTHDELLAEEGGRYWQMWQQQASGIRDGGEAEPTADSGGAGLGLATEAKPKASDNGNSHGNGHGHGH